MLFWRIYLMDNNIKVKANCENIISKLSINIREIEVKSYITKSQLPGIDFVINPYVGCPHKCIYCYAEFMKRFVNEHNIEDWGDFLDVKKCSIPINLNKIKKDKKVLISSVTDPYNPYECKYKITRSILKQFIYFCCLSCLFSSYYLYMLLSPVTDLLMKTSVLLYMRKRAWNLLRQMYTALHIPGITKTGTRRGIWISCRGWNQ